MTVIHQNARIMPFVYSAKRGIRLGEEAHFDLTPPAGQAFQLENINFAAFAGWDGLLLPIDHPLWLHSIVRLMSYEKRVTEAPLFRLADPQLYAERYPQKFSGALRSLPWTIASQEPTECVIFTHATKDNDYGYTLMLIADMQKQEII